MANSEIKIFYSWQSDLPGSKTRYLIQDSIDAVVNGMKDTIEIIADRDTKGEFGSPDIAQTIFSKIDESDIFIADVSVVNKYFPIGEDGEPKQDVKTSPNPNVLLELGYAAQSLGWENVICIINTDFGAIDDLPFDIKHRRLTPFSLEGRDKASVKKELRDIIVATAMNLLENGVRPKGASTNHIVGTYNMESKCIQKQLIPFNFINAQEYKSEQDMLLANCRSLIEQINAINIQPQEEPQTQQDKERKNDPHDEIDMTHVNKLMPLKLESLGKFSSSPQLVKVQNKDKEFVSRMVKDWFDIDLPDEFFYLGNLQIKTSILAMQSSEYIGTEDEKKKNDAFQELEYNLHRIKLLKIYKETFAGMYLFPLAIQNTSSVADKDISITVIVDGNTVDVILPNTKLINSELIGLEGLIYEEGLVKKLLMMPDTSDIQYDDDISFDIQDSISQIRNVSMPRFGSSYPQYDSSDYEREVQKYIASPIKGSQNEFVFHIKSLRPKENSWLGAGILVRPKTNKVSFSYIIKSQHSDGSLSGKLEFEIAE